MSNKMRAVQLFAPGDVRCELIDIPVISADNQVIIKVEACGVCGSDIPRVMSKGAYRYPIVIGHEFSGEVVEVGTKVKNAKVGDRVTAMPLVNCKECDYCKIGQAITCDNYDYYGSRIDGAMAEYIVVSEENIIHIPDNVSYYEAAMTDPVSVALHAVRKAEIEAGQTAVVFGLGAIGFITIQWLKHMGCHKVIAVDIIDEKLDMAKKLGADLCINGMKCDVVKTIMEYTNNKGADSAIELAGSTITQVQAIDSVRKLGTVVFCGIAYNDLVIPNKSLGKILRGELKIKGSWNSSIAPLPINEWKSALMFIEEGKIKLNELITHVVCLEDCQSAFEMMYNKKEMFTKVIFDPNKKQI
ncbi:galactitol-1-phosphate 5-dehydrogenase [Ruminiclostridium cellulolyticum]|uniref:Alcohol dehydrogenase GroES domain protein n=1 Tax=Ruminiclostridium cellulolyticum (strain ATCC 35319 / DSM 5812 / JCM 6584 / H10) TaxID=394503 RepID=B8I9D1_RUMCH|nr:galactitol-1-phosphate 5-dehydrogenase [Ruminiclostridium cellulolyticum]ACL75391.1 Alcohol dehydrogenase GroES domain protein [Ruminiclostridium cellulolyticum H10]